MEENPYLTNHALGAFVDYLEVGNGDCEGRLYQRILIAEENAFACNEASRDGIERCLLLCRDRIKRQAQVIENLNALGADIAPAEAFMANLLFTQQVLVDM